MIAHYSNPLLLGLGSYSSKSQLGNYPHLERDYFVIAILSRCYFIIDVFGVFLSSSGGMTGICVVVYEALNVTTDWLYGLSQLHHICQIESPKVVYEMHRLYLDLK